MGCRECGTAVMADIPQLECGIGNFNPMEREREIAYDKNYVFLFSGSTLFLGTKCGTKGTDIRLIRGKTWF